MDNSEFSDEERRKKEREKELNRKRVQKSRKKKVGPTSIDYLTRPTAGAIRETYLEKKKIANFRKKIMSIVVTMCSICLEKFPMMYNVNETCRRCRLDKKEPKLFSAANQMDPGAQPEELKGLSMIEECLIAQACAVMKIWRMPSGQLKYRGHCIAFPQDVSDFAQVLPRLRSEISVLTVRKYYSDGHADFRVRRHKVEAALRWLKENNRFYTNIEINRDRLNELPIDGFFDSGFKSVIDVDDVLNNIEIINNCDGENIEGADNIANEGDVINGPEYSGMMTDVVVNQNKVINEVLDEFENKNFVPWPKQGNEALSEFKDEGIMSRCFPCLFPRGNCDLYTIRPRDVSILQYARHLMKYVDGRFGLHKTFSYYILNRIMRSDALKKGALFFKSKEKIFPTIEDLKKKMKDGKRAELANQIVYFGGKERGSQAYWSEQKKNVTAMVDQTRIPSFFVTLSSADGSWPEVDELIQKMYNKEKRKGNYNNVNEHPLPVSWLFQERVNMFIKDVLPCIFDLEDFWFRYEWQSRGSPHVHGILWTKSSPDVSKIEQEEVREKIQHYFHMFVTTMVFDKEYMENTKQRIASSNPCARDPQEIDNEWEDYLDLSAFVQPHKYCSSYCQKFNKKKKYTECRFGFPQSIEMETVLKKCDDKWKLLTQRNCEWINTHNIDILRVWRANVDVKAIIDKEAVMAYLLKYATKSEILSKRSSELFELLLNQGEDDDSVVPVVQKMLMKLIGQRDYSSQEVFHILMGWSLVKSSRTFECIKMYWDNEYSILGSPETPSAFFNYLDQYLNRNILIPNFSDLTFWDYIKKVNRGVGSRLLTLRKNEPIIVVYPYLSKNILSEDYCRNYVTLHKPCTMYRGGFICPYISWEMAYLKLIEEQGDLNVNNIQDGIEGVEDEYEEEIVNDEEIGSQLQWMSSIGLCPPGKIITDQMLGKRPLDKLFDWEQYAPEISNIEKVCVDLDKKKLEKVIKPRVVIEEKCNSDQEEVLNYVRDHILSGTREPMKVVVEGKAGTGKSFLIAAIKDLVTDLCGEEAVVVTAPTGSAASNLDAQTTHSFVLYRVNKYGEIVPLKGTAEQKLQKNCEKIILLIIDEMSMLGMEMLGIISQRLKQARPEHADEDFARISMILLGDFGQLPCVGDKPLYCQPSKETNKKEKWQPKHVAGYGLFSKFEKKFDLKIQMRQSGETEEDLKFRQVLDNLRDGSTTIDDWNFLATRHENNLDQEEKIKFANALRVFASNRECDEYNKEKLRAENKPVVKICSQDYGKTSEYKGNLQQNLFLCEGARVMLTQNLWVTANLVNGSLGTVKKIIFGEGETSGTPRFVIVEFDNFSGETLIDGFPKCVPIRVQYHGFVSSNSENGSRKQFPLVLAYAITIHKCQGLTLKKMVINLGLKEFACGLSYVGLSRCKKLSDIIIVGLFTYDRLCGFTDKYHMKQRLAYDTRMKEGVTGKADGEDLSAVIVDLEALYVS